MQRDPGMGQEPKADPPAHGGAACGGGAADAGASAAVLVTVSPQGPGGYHPLGGEADRKRPGLPVPRRFPRPAHSAISDHRPAGGICGDGPTDGFAAGNVTYKNSDGDMILLSYTYMHDGAHDGFILDNTDTVSDIRVSGMPGKLILSSLEDHDSYVTWIDVPAICSSLYRPPPTRSA